MSAFDRNRQRLGVVAITVALGLSARVTQAGPTTFPIGETAPSDRAALRAALGTDRFAVQSLKLAAQPGEPVEIRVQLGAQDYAVGMVPFSLRADDFRILAQRADGSFERIEPPPVATLRGDIATEAGSWVRGALIRGGLEAVIGMADGTKWVIQPVGSLVAGADPTAHVVYRGSDVPRPAGFCGVDLLPEEPVADDDQGGFGPRGNYMRICDVAFDADFEYFTANGSSVANVVNDIEFVMNGVEIPYERDVSVTFEVTTIVVRTAEPDPYTSAIANTLLNQFRAAWNLEFGAIRRDIAHLMTGKDVGTASGGTIGLAFVSVVCLTAQGYGLSQSQYSFNPLDRFILTAHELGHNFSARHCDADPECRIMCSNGACEQSTDYAFSAGEIGAIVPYAEGRFCLIPEPPRSGIPFAQPIDQFDLDFNQWTYVEGVLPSVDCVNPPSVPYALQLNAAGDGAHDDDDVRSRAICVNGLPGITASYWVQARGVAQGHALVVEAYTSQLRWATLNRIVSDGVDDEAFTQFVHPVSGSLVHSEFRLRFRAEVDGPGETWYVDDIMVTSPMVGCMCDWRDDGILNSQDFFDFLTAFFNGSADFNQDCVTNSQDFFDFLACFFMGCP